ncbi:hypothetical protein GA707_16835 [Nostocoides sp. F2B08]|uniref:PxKF domain-containing protein n=1 Tax=Nostocoides sp. F2B08 TaxID=2653936 RepID=UPI001262F70C|nr:PxKF domain-containing protein [Tetrasphaera sp. F2B08]KAB7741879.1 hypothetical protein GA707_16835 [Tetrasphaera sp. F2B08]
MATQQRHRGTVRLAIAGLIAGTLAFAAGTPAVAAEDEKILVYTGNNAYTDDGYTRFGQAVGLPVETNSTLPQDLSGYACIVLPLNRAPFSPEITDAFVAFVNEGGNLLAQGDSPPGFDAANTNMNQIAQAAGASMSLTNQRLDLPPQFTTLIDPSPLTDGVSSVGYATTTAVSLTVDGAAQSLVRMREGGDAPGTTFIAAETVGSGTLVLLGDSNVLSDTLAWIFYADHDNDVLAKNLCLGSLQQYSFEGFFGPVAKDVVNTVKGGSTVPLQFRVFDGDTEITDPAVVESFTVTSVVCPDEDSPAEEVEFTTTGKTELRYADGRFQQNWKTPKTKGCYQVTVATTDGAALTADFVLR